MTKRISIDKLKAGMVIIKITQQNGPSKIKKSGAVSSDDMVKALAEMGVQEVEIDPDMTVEVKRPKIAKSKTQQLLEDTSGPSQHVDQGLAEQFNRSLFLPSVQELPEAWQYYGKKSGIAALVILGGFCLGWVVANIGNIGNWTQQTPSIVTQPASEPVTMSTDKPEQVESEVLTPPLSDEQVRLRLAELEREKLAKLEQEKAEQDQKRLEEQQRAEQQALARQQQAQDQQAQEEQANIPPDLLRRFQNAMEDIGDSNSPDPGVDVEPIKNVPAVQDLPAWVLTQLPSLAFSAHMYASESRDRWVRVNGRRVLEGQEIEDGLVLVGIEPQHVILAFQGQEFSMNALSDW